MREHNYHLYLSGSEQKIVIENLLWFQNKLREKEWYTDAVDELISKFSKAKPKKIRVK